jgi:hypothetical protein
MLSLNFRQQGLAGKSDEQTVSKLVRDEGQLCANSRHLLNTLKQIKLMRNDGHRDRSQLILVEV